jgi:hypothetical protein
LALSGALGGEHLIDDDSAAQPLTNDDISKSDEDDDQSLNDLYESTTQGEINLDKIMVSAAHAGKSIPIC